MEGVVVGELEKNAHGREARDGRLEGLPGRVMAWQFDLGGQAIEANGTVRRHGFLPSVVVLARASQR